MNPDIRDLPAMLQQTLRTGIILPAAQIAAATGKSIDEAGRALAIPADVHAHIEELPPPDQL